MSQRQVVLVYEDELSGAVLRKLLLTCAEPLVVGREIPTRGFGRMKGDVEKYKSASHVLPHIVLTDLDAAECAPALIDDWNLKSVKGRLVFRIAVREVESWLLADRTGLSAFLGVPASKIPANPDEVVNPKQSLIGIARRSKRRRLAEELVPTPGSTSSIGPLYNQRLSEFVADKWNVSAACKRSMSLARAMRRIGELGE